MISTVLEAYIYTALNLDLSKLNYLKSFCLSGLSCINHNKSNLESKAAGNCIFCSAVFFGLYLPYAGFAAASIDTLAFKVVMIPAWKLHHKQMFK